MKSPPIIEKLIAHLEKLPGLGPRSSARIVYYLLRQPQEQIERLADSLQNLKKEIRICSICFNVNQSDPCEICQDDSRDHSIICVVEEPQDLEALERTGKFKGVYHVLGGYINPHRGVGPEQLKMKNLLERLENDGIEEIILATNPTTEGEVTAMYLNRIIHSSENPKIKNVKVTRIARGVSTGSELEFVDDLTLIRALEGRQEY